MFKLNIWRSFHKHNFSLSLIQHHQTSVFCSGFSLIFAHEICHERKGAGWRCRRNRVPRTAVLTQPLVLQEHAAWHICHCINWVKSYLTDRNFTVSTGDSVSDSAPLICGVWQGLVLGGGVLKIYAPVKVQLLP